MNISKLLSSVFVGLLIGYLINIFVLLPILAYINGEKMFWIWGRTAW